MAALRSFIALPAGPKAQQAIADVQSQLKSIPAAVKWEEQDKFHITLVFLGTVDQSKLELLSTGLAASIQQFPFCSLRYTSLGAFPNLHNPRVVWIGIETNHTVMDLQAETEHLCVKYGFPKEDRKFHPHITLGRVKENRNLVRLTDAIKTITFEPIETVCSEILLMKSELHPSGSLYTILKSFPLHT